MSRKPPDSKRRGREDIGHSPIAEALDQLPQGVTIFDENLDLVAWNTAVQGLLDLPDEMFRVGKNLADVFRYNAERGEYGTGDIEEQVRERVALARKFEPHRMERVRPDGTVLEIVGNPLPSGGFITTYTDITERRKTERDLVTSRDRLGVRVAQRTAQLRDTQDRLTEEHALLEITLENMSQGITLFDENLNVMVLNRRYKELLDFPDELAIPGTHLSEFFRYNAVRGEYGDGDIEDLVRERIELARKSEPHRFRRSRPDGTVLEIVGTPLEDGGFVTTYEDITAQVGAEETIRASEEHLERLVNHRTGELAASEHRFRSLTDMLPLSICETDVSGDITYVNRRAAETFGYPFDDLGDYPPLQEMAAPHERERARANTAKVLERGEERSSGTEYVLQRRDGSQFPALVYSAPILEGGKPIGMRSAIVDISDRKTVELQLIEAKEEAETANQAKSDFLASMSHELRTPLNAVLGFAQILQLDRQNPLTTLQNEYLDGILDGGQHLLELVDEILDLAKIEADQLVLSPENVNACEIVADCIALSVPIGESRGIQIIDRLCHGPAVFLRTDCLRFRQVLLNLLSNAVKYNETGGSVTVSGEVKDNGFVRISVTDTGVGIAEEDVGSVFQMFHRVGADPMKASEGTGIGLTVTKLLVEKLAGRIGFDSEVGVGSTFWIELPLASN